MRVIQGASVIGLRVLNAYNRFLAQLGQKGIFPDTPYPDIYTVFPGAKILEDNYPVILEEYNHFINSDKKQLSMTEIGLYGGNTENLLPWNKQQNSTDEPSNDFKWHSTFIKAGSQFIDANARFYPKTIALIKEIPEIYNVFFSSIGPHTHIAPHYGYTKAFLRYHLGIIIPQGRQCYLQVDGIKYYWEAGKSVVFDDMYLHSAFNGSSEVRTILYIDFLRPLPFPYHFINQQLVKMMYRSSKAKDILKIIK